MRESIGGAWLFGIVIVFITLFASFLTYSISYTKAFNTKNKIIDFIEQNEGYSTYKEGGDVSNPNYTYDRDESVEGKVFNYISSIGYNYSVDESCDQSFGKGYEYGYCAYKICPDPNDNISDVHYKVTTYIVLEIPIIGLKVRIPISGETRIIYEDKWGVPCYDPD